MTENLNLPLPCIDEILEIEKGKYIRSRRSVEPHEEYFIDHFKNFAVLPGVLMLEGLVQSAQWYIRFVEDFKHSQIAMKSCRQAKYSRIVRPKTKIEFKSELMSSEGSEYHFKGKVTEGENTVASARFSLFSQPLANLSSTHGHLEDSINNKYRDIFNNLNKAQQVKTS